MFYIQNWHYVFSLYDPKTNHKYVTIFILNTNKKKLRQLELRILRTLFRAKRKATKAINKINKDENIHK